MDSFTVEPSGRNDEYQWQIRDNSFGRDKEVALVKTESEAQDLAEILNEAEK